MYVHSKDSMESNWGGVEFYSRENSKTWINVDILPRIYPELFTGNVVNTQNFMIGHGVWNKDKKLTGDYLPTSTLWQ